VNFNGRPAGKWTPGKYRADIFVDGKLAKNLTFEIKGPAGAVTASGAFAPNPRNTAKPVGVKPRKKSSVPFMTQAVNH
jgi:hypothetical protein